MKYLSKHSLSNRVKLEVTANPTISGQSLSEMLTKSSSARLLFLLSLSIISALSNWFVSIRILRIVCSNALFWINKIIWDENTSKDFPSNSSFVMMNNFWFKYQICFKISKKCDVPTKWVYNYVIARGYYTFLLFFSSLFIPVSIFNLSNGLCIRLMALLLTCV